MIVVTYALVSEKAPNCQNAYNIWAILSLDLFMAILWLSSMGANAALRGTFTYKVSADCYDDGSAVNAGHCVVNGKRSTTMVRRAAVATDAGLAEMSAIAGLSALEMYVFRLPQAFSLLRKRTRDANLHLSQASVHCDARLQRTRIPHAPSGEDGSQRECWPHGDEGARSGGQHISISGPASIPIPDLSAAAARTGTATTI